MPPRARHAVRASKRALSQFLENPRTIFREETFIPHHFGRATETGGGVSGTWKMARAGAYRSPAELVWPGGTLEQRSSCAGGEVTHPSVAGTRLGRVARLLRPA